MADTTTRKEDTTTRMEGGDPVDANSVKLTEGGKRPLERMTSYNNRYRSPSVESATPCPLTPDPEADPEAGGVRLQRERRQSVQSRRSQFQRLVSLTPSVSEGHPDLALEAPDDVFDDASAVGGKARPLGQTLSLASTVSSTAAMLPNPHTRLSHGIHDCFWCCYCLYFAFFCCLPAVRLMERSDSAFARGQEDKARSLGRLATAMFAVGTVLTLVLFAGLLFIIIYFTSFHK